MSNKAWKRIVRFLIIFLIVVIGIIAFFCFSGSDGVLTGKQYLKAQEKYMAEFEAYADDMDNIVTLYLNGDIGEEDFLNHLKILQEELTIMNEAHDKEAEKYSVITGTHTYQTKRGCEAVDECYDIFQNILSMMQNNYQDKNALSYKYIAYHQDIINSVSDYMTARDDTFGIEDNGKESE